MKVRLTTQLVAMATALCLCSCDFLDTLWERIQVLTIDFQFERLDVSGLVYPSLLQTAQDVWSLNPSNRRSYGVDVRCRLRARNPNKHAASFDGAAIFLRAGDTSQSAQAVQTSLPAFRIPAGGEGALDLVFPIRLDNPIFAYGSWTRLVRGDSLPYRLSADLFFRLFDENAPEAAQELGNSSLSLNVARGSVDAAETGTAVLDLVLAYLKILFGV